MDGILDVLRFGLGYVPHFMILVSLALLMEALRRSFQTLESWHQKRKRERQDRIREQLFIIMSRGFRTYRYNENKGESGNTRTLRWTPSVGQESG